MTSQRRGVSASKVIALGRIGCSGPTLPERALARARLLSAHTFSWCQQSCESHRRAGRAMRLQETGCMGASVHADASSESHVCVPLCLCVVYCVRVRACECARLSGSRVCVRSCERAQMAFCACAFAHRAPGLEFVAESNESAAGWCAAKRGGKH
eukprot:6179564-Pleurochrysis_carterae.AAC.1